MILNSCKEMTQSIQSDVLEKYLMRAQVDTQKDQIKDDPKQPPKE